MAKKGAMVVDKTVAIILAVVGLAVFVLVIIFFKNKGMEILDGIKGIFSSG